MVGRGTRYGRKGDQTMSDTLSMGYLRAAVTDRSSYRPLCVAAVIDPYVLLQL